MDASIINNPADTQISSWRSCLGTTDIDKGMETSRPTQAFKDQLGLVKKLREDVAKAFLDPAGWINLINSENPKSSHEDVMSGR